MQRLNITKDIGTREAMRSTYGKLMSKLNDKIQATTINPKIVCNNDIATRICFFLTSAFTKRWLFIVLSSENLKK
jgi:hypothetical protein